MIFSNSQIRKSGTLYLNHRSFLMNPRTIAAASTLDLQNTWSVHWIFETGPFLAVQLNTCSPSLSLIVALISLSLIPALSLRPPRNPCVCNQPTLVGDDDKDQPKFVILVRWLSEIHRVLPLSQGKLTMRPCSRLRLLWCGLRWPTFGDGKKSKLFVILVTRMIFHCQTYVCYDKIEHSVTRSSVPDQLFLPIFCIILHAVFSVGKLCSRALFGPRVADIT